MKSSSYYLEWQKNRINFILNLYSREFFKGKKILELGSFNGYIGNYFKEVLGADVTSVEGRFGNYLKIKNNYPSLKVKFLNLDNPKWILGKYDIIINFDLYYYLEKFHKEHLTNCIQNCDLLFLESVVYDSFDSELFFRNEKGIDQSLSNRTGTPSTSYIEDILKENNCKFVKYCDSALNSSGYHYDWKDNNSKRLDEHARRFWVVENNLRFNLDSITEKHILVDVGANWGGDSLPVCNSNKKVFCWAFEPTPELADHLIKHGNKERYFVHQIALSDFDGEAHFHIADQSDWGCSSLNTFSDNLDQTWPGRTDLHFNRSVPVKVMRFDTWYELNGKPFSKIDYFHCDTQGSDLKVLMGMGKYLNLIRAGVVECATSEHAKLYKENHTEQEMIEFLQNNNFKIDGRQLNDHFGNEVNIYFSKQK